MNEMRELAAKLRKTANMLDELAGVTTHNETPKTAKKIAKSVRKLRKNPWDNPAYRKDMLVRLAAARRKALKIKKATK